MNIPTPQSIQQGP